MIANNLIANQVFFFVLNVDSGCAKRDERNQKDNKSKIGKKYLKYFKIKRTDHLNKMFNLLLHNGVSGDKFVKLIDHLLALFKNVTKFMVQQAH